MTITARDQLERLLQSLSREERLEALELVVSSLRDGADGRVLQSLEGLWKDRFSADFDVDRALREIRASWQRDAFD